MNDVPDYPSRLFDPASRRCETFSYLPPLSAEQIRRQVRYIVSQGWNPAIEHNEPEHALDCYWSMWQLPLFGETDVERILAEADACRQAYPTHHVRLIGYDHRAQCQGTAMVIYRAPVKA